MSRSLRALATVNVAVLALGRRIAWMAMGLMVVVIMIQVFCRYILNNALPWPDEAARFLMLWMSCLIAPTAYRRGGFVSIGMLAGALGQKAGALLSLALLLLALAVLVIAVGLGIEHVKSGLIFNSSSLKLPLFVKPGIPIKLAWMYASMLVGVLLLIMVSAELILRQAAQMLGVGGLPVIADEETLAVD